MANVAHQSGVPMTDLTFPQFIESLGELHDARLIRMQWLPQDERFEIEVADMYSNFLGLPEYPGAARGMFTFSGVSALDVSVVLKVERLTIYGWEFDAAGTSNILFSPGGRIVVACNQILCTSGSEGKRMWPPIESSRESS